MAIGFVSSKDPLTENDNFNAEKVLNTCRTRCC